MTRPDAPRDGTVQSVDRAISILEVIARRHSLGVTAIAGELGLNKTTVFRLLSTMEARGLVEQNEDRGEYRLGVTANMLSAGVNRQPGLAATCRPVAIELASRVSETVNVSVLEGSEVMTVDQVAGTTSIGAIDWIGRRTPAHATAAGKILLAFLSADQRDQLLPNPLPAYTDRTIVDREQLDAQLAAARVDGIAYTYGESEVGEVSLGAPIRRLDGVVFAALTVAAPTYRFSDDVLPPVRAALVEAADKISWRFGWAKRA